VFVRYSSRILAGTSDILTEVVLQTLEANAGIIPQIGHDRFHPNPLILSSDMLVSIMTASLNNQKIYQFIFFCVHIGVIFVVIIQ
jgi:hypothetical protein